MGWLKFVIYDFRYRGWVEPPGIRDENGVQRSLNPGGCLRPGNADMDPSGGYVKDK